MENFGQRLRKLRKSRHLTQADLAKKLGFSTSSISMYEKGMREPNNAKLEKIGVFFGVGVNYLISGNNNGPKNIAELLAEIRRSINEAEGLVVNGKIITEADKEELFRAMMVATTVMFPDSVKNTNLSSTSNNHSIT